MRTRFLVGLALATTLGSLPAQAPGADADTSKPRAILAGKLYVGNGEVMQQAYLIVQDGKVVRVSQDKPAEMPIVDASTKTIMPGIVAADSSLTRVTDDQYNVTPDFVAAEGFDFMQKFPSALSGGVTSAYLSPSRNRFISGQGSVVKLAGEGLLDRVVAEKASLRIALGAAATRAGAVFEPGITPTADNPLKPARQQYPSSRLSQLRELRKLFNEAQTTKNATMGSGSAENRYSPQPLRDVASGKLRLRMAAQELADLNSAVRFASQIGVAVVLENPFAVEKLLQLHDDKKLMMVCRMPVRPGAPNAGGEDRLDESTKNDPRNAVLASQAGATVALVPATDQDLPDFLMIAGMAVRFGMSPKAALAAITLDAAKVLGVDDRIGSLEAGKDADFLVLSGEPFAIGTMVEDTFINGKQAWHRKTESSLLVVKAARIITCDGKTYDNGSVIVQRGKIKGVGTDLAVPYGARVIDLGNAVIVPGFVDAYCHAGLSGEGTRIPRGAASQQLTDIIEPNDPVLRAVAASGMTTVMVSGTDGGLVSGRVAAIKTAAKDRKSMVLRDIAGIRFVHDNISEGGIKALASKIDQGKRYIATWKKYEKAVADWKAGKKKKKPAEKPKPKAGDKPKAGADPVTGTWTLTFDPVGGRRVPFSFLLELKLNGSKVTGTNQMRIGQRAMGKKVELQNGKWEAGKLSLEVPTAANRPPAKLSATIEGETMKGTLEMPRRGGTRKQPVTGKKGDAAPSSSSSSSSSKSSKKKKKDDKPKKPKVNEALEPMRALLEKKIPAIVRTTRAPAISQVVDYFEKQKLPYILSGIRDAIDTPEILGEARPGVLVRPDFKKRKKGKMTNAAAKLSDHGLPVALVSAATEGSKYLPFHAANAIRWGMDPEEALKALTIYPAKMFKLDDRIGSLKRGKDADFVAYVDSSSRPGSRISPFAMTSRVQLVVVNGEIVVDNREEAK